MVDFFLIKLTQFEETRSIGNFCLSSEFLDLYFCSSIVELAFLLKSSAERKCAELGKNQVKPPKIKFQCEQFLKLPQKRENGILEAYQQYLH